MKLTPITLAMSLSMRAATAFSLDCGQLSMKSVAEETVRYFILGAGHPATRPECYKSKKTSFKYFRPDLTEPFGDLLSIEKIYWFEPKTDSFKILSVKEENDKHAVRVRFEFKNRDPLRTTIYFKFDHDLEKVYGVCGMIYNDKHTVISTECKKSDEELKAFMGKRRK